jgi:DNA-binding NarL/FixJ family response regulator
MYTWHRATGIEGLDEVTGGGLPKGRTTLVCGSAGSSKDRSRKDRAGKDRAQEILSDRELQVLRLVARGYSSPQIAIQIFLSVKTVETYRSRFANKLGLRTRSDIVGFAVQMGLLTPQALEAEEGSQPG